MTRSCACLARAASGLPPIRARGTTDADCAAAPMPNHVVPRTMRSDRQRGGAMATHHRNGGAPVLELKPPPRTQTAPTVLSPVAEVHETATDIVVRIRLQQGALELSVPKRALTDARPEQDDVPGADPDAAAC